MLCICTGTSGDSSANTNVQQRDLVFSRVPHLSWGGCTWASLGVQELQAADNSPALILSQIAGSGESFWMKLVLQFGGLKGWLSVQDPARSELCTAPCLHPWEKQSPAGRRSGGVGTVSV